MKFLLDTNAVVALQTRQPVFMERLRHYQPSDFGVSTIVLHELVYGIHRSKRKAENRVRVEELSFEILSFAADDAEEAGRIRALLADEGTPIGPFDSLIAGQALARSLIVVTNNVREFRRVPGLVVEDWLE